MKFEYKTGYISDSTTVEGVLNKLGNAGWELVIYDVRGFIVLKRRQEEEEEET